MAHKFFCDLYGISVYKVKYFAMSKNAGSVTYKSDVDSRKKAFVGLAPLLINTIACFLFLIPEILPVFLGTSFVSTYTFADIFLIWIGISCGANALPSNTDLVYIDKNASWTLTFIKRFIQILNLGGVVGSFLGILIIFLISSFILFGSLFAISNFLLIIIRIFC